MLLLQKLNKNASPLSTPCQGCVLGVGVCFFFTTKSKDQDPLGTLDVAHPKLTKIKNQKLRTENQEAKIKNHELETKNQELRTKK